MGAFVEVHISGDNQAGVDSAVHRQDLTDLFFVLEAVSVHTLMQELGLARAHTLLGEGYTLFNLAHAFRMKNDLNMASEAAQAARNLFTDIEAGGADAAQHLLDAIAAARTGNRWSEAKALLACADHSLSVPDFLNPQDLVTEACRIAEAEGMSELIAKGDAVLEKISDLGRPTPRRNREDKGLGCHPRLPGCFCE